MEVIHISTHEARRESEQSDLSEMLLTDRVVLVTGAAAGIGRAAAELMGRRGATVGLFDFNRAALEDTAFGLSSEGIRIVPLLGSATSPADCRAAADHLVSKFGRLDVLVNNVGGSIIPAMPLWEVSDEQWSQVIELNLTSAFNFCRAVVPHMLTKSYGRIINVASTAGKEGNPMTAAYCTAKAGVIGLTKSLGKELATSGILVTAVSPAVVETEGTQADDESPEKRAHLDRLRAKIPMSRMGTPKEVARLIGFLASDHLSFSTGSVYDISGGRATY